jgi:hypothetical protein
VNVQNKCAPSLDLFVRLMLGEMVPVEQLKHLRAQKTSASTYFQ